MQDANQVILVMRHAEKPEDVGDPNLAPAGQARAQALAEYIPEQFFTPDFILAAAISKHSARPYETVKPLSERTGTPIDATTADQDYAFLAREIRSDARYAAKHIVVCWHHGNIPSLMRALGAAGGTYPDPWDPAVFNLILKLEFADALPAVVQVTEPF
jgi:phosphohistidine phosphatase SixA